MASVCKITRIVLVGVFGLIVVFVAGYWALAQLLHHMEPNDEALRKELGQAAERNGLILVNLRGSPAMMITFAKPPEWQANNKLGFASIAPDGKHLFVYGRLPLQFTEGGYGIVRPDGSVAVPMPLDPWRVVKPSANQYLLSPDLSKLCVLDLRRPLELFSLVSPEIERLPIADEKLQGARAVSWDPSSSRIAFESNRAIYTYDLKRGTSVYLVNGSDPAWAPSGQWIAFRSLEGEAMIVPPNGGSSQHLMKGLRVIHGFVWSPDAKYLAFTREYPLTFPLDSPAYLGIYRLSDGARCIAIRYSFKGTPLTSSYGWLYVPELLKGQ